MKAAYIKAPFAYELREFSDPEPARGEVVVRVRACGYCGHDNILASYKAVEWEPFGHEFSGEVEKVGEGVDWLKAGDRVVIETSTFNPLSELARDGRADLDQNGPSYMELRQDSMGFSTMTRVPAELCVKFDGLSYAEACFTEPLGVAVDLFKTADVRLGDDVLIVGLGPIGLMALQLVKACGARKICVAEYSQAKARCDLALEFGADCIIHTDKTPLEQYPFPGAGVDRVLVTAPPKVIASAVETARVAGIIAFLGISYGKGEIAQFNSNTVHLKKLQIRGSNAIPAMYFPFCLELIKSGAVEVTPLLTHAFGLDELPAALARYNEEKNKAIKAVMLN